MNLTGPWLTTRSDGSATLSHHITVAIFDYQRAFSHEPKLIVLPYFRRDELAASAGELYPITAGFGSNGENTFRGIRLRFSTTNDSIELCGSL